MHKKSSFPAVLLLTDVPRWQPSLEEVRTLPPNIWLIIRHPTDLGLAQEAVKFSPWVPRKGQKLLLSRSQALAMRTGAGGVHLAETQLFRPSRWRGVAVKKDFIISAACHSYAALRRAKQLGVHLALLSPVAATQSHPKQQPLGIYTAGAYARCAGMPVYALGGMTWKKVAFMKKKGFCGIAGVGLAAKR